MDIEQVKLTVTTIAHTAGDFEAAHGLEDNLYHGRRRLGHRHHPEHLMSTANEAARAAARAKLAGLFPGQTGINFADEIADTITTAIREHIREQVATEIEQATVTVDGGTYPMQTARTVERALTVAAAIARGTDTIQSDT